MAGAKNSAQLNRLVQLLHDHPDVELMSYADETATGQTLEELYPALTGETELPVSHDVDTQKVDVVFLAGEPEAARRFMERELPENLYVIDMTGYFRENADERFVQGIPELNRKAMVRGARYVAMPDAATTAVALALLPLAKNLLLRDSIGTAVVTNDNEAETDSLTSNLLGETTTRSIIQAARTLQPGWNETLKGIVFSGDIPEGLMAVTTVETDLSAEELIRLYEEFYDDHSFTFIVDNVPDINDVRDTNKSFIHIRKDDGKAVITSVLDTDMKGGAGNAVHVMNLLFGLLEKVGI